MVLAHDMGFCICCSCFSPWKRKSAFHWGDAAADTARSEGWALVFEGVNGPLTHCIAAKLKLSLARLVWEAEIKRHRGTKTRFLSKIWEYNERNQLIWQSRENMDDVIDTPFSIPWPLFYSLYQVLPRAIKSWVSLRRKAQKLSWM